MKQKNKDLNFINFLSFVLFLVMPQKIFIKKIPNTIDFKKFYFKKNQKLCSKYMEPFYKKKKYLLIIGGSIVLLIFMIKYKNEIEGFCKKPDTKKDAVKKPEEAKKETHSDQSVKSDRPSQMPINESPTKKDRQSELFSILKKFVNNEKEYKTKD